MEIILKFSSPSFSLLPFCFYLPIRPARQNRQKREQGRGKIGREEERQGLLPAVSLALRSCTSLSIILIRYQCTTYLSRHGGLINDDGSRIIWWLDVNQVSLPLFLSFLCRYLNGIYRSGKVMKGKIKNRDRNRTTWMHYYTVVVWALGLQRICIFIYFFGLRCFLLVWFFCGFW